MTTHELAVELLSLPNLTAVIPGSGDDEGSFVEVGSIEELVAKYLATGAVMERSGELVVIDL
jgi:hypothetical protein